MACCNGIESKSEWKPLENRSCTDIPWLFLFTLFCIGMACICGYPFTTGAASRLISGYDSYGNICGQDNPTIPGETRRNKNMTENKYVFFLDPCNLDVRNRKVNSVALCVSKCPTSELKTYLDLRLFAEQNKSLLCDYDITAKRYTSHADRNTKCPKLPVLPSKPVLHRCVPVNISCYVEFAQAMVTFINDNTLLRRLAKGVMESKEVIAGLCVLALALSVLMMVVIHYISKVLLWILAAVVIIGSLVGTAVLWWLYADHRKACNEGTLSPFGKEVASNNVNVLLACAIGATIFTFILLIVVIIMRKRVALTISLFHLAGKVFIQLPLLFLQPVWTFICLMLFWAYWIVVLLLLGTSGTPVYNNYTDVVEYEMQGTLQFLVWYHVVGLIWITEFILAFQQMTISGAVVTYYFTKDKSEMPSTPVLSSILRTIRYHLGTLAKGSFLITLIKIPRLILTYIHSQLKGRENAIARCMLKACVCCLWVLEKCLAYLNQNAYTATAINSTGFCTSAREAFLILVENVLRVAAINSVGDFILFLGKVIVVSLTALAGVLALNYQRDYTVWVLPLLIVCLFAFLVAHCFLSVYENVVNVLFLCFAVDTKYNDGSPGREYYMDKSLMEYVENCKNTGLYKTGEREMKTMAY